MNHSSWTDPLITLEDMLEARQDRAAMQRAMITRHHCPLISFTLNIAGPRKCFAEAEMAFDEGCRLIEASLQSENLPMMEKFVRKPNTGYELFCAVDAPAIQLKQRMCAIENSSPMARLFDVDVLDADGQIVSREMVGLEPRACLLCGKQAHLCARSRAHSVEDLMLETRSRIEHYFHEQHAQYIAKTALRALLYELSVTPKPGLVDRADCGAHTDMDYYTFVDSATALMPYFKTCALRGMDRTLSIDRVLQALRSDGICAEVDMYTATHGVNTHKGAIFSLGILCAATGRLYANQETLTLDQLLKVCGEIAFPVLQDFSQIEQAQQQTHGILVYLSHQKKGARGEAAAGFPTVRQWGYPVLSRMLLQGYSQDQAGAYTLLHLMANTEDTNMIKRIGDEASDLIRSRLKSMLDKNLPDECLKHLDRLNGEFIKMNLSPGGCADLLALSWMLVFLLDHL